MMGEKNENRNFKMLKETPDFLSGQQLCEGLGVSRTAVWKAIRQLEEEGYAIEAVRNRGYRLVASPDVITAPELKTVLSTVWLGSQVNCFYETDSTNRQARKLAEEGAPHGTLCCSRQPERRKRKKRTGLGLSSRCGSLDEFYTSP